jgi:hypothetical protein
MFREFPHCQYWRRPDNSQHPAWDARIDWQKYQLMKAAKSGQWDSYEATRDSIFDSEAVSRALKECGKDLFNHREYGTIESAYKALTTAPKLQSIWNSMRPGIFLDSVSTIEREDPERAWLALKDKIETWSTKMPDSQLAKIALANFWIEYAWKARGSGWANTVTEEGWRLMKERLATAHQILDETPRDLPGWYEAKLTVCLGEGIEVKSFVNEGATKFPWFSPIFTQTVYYLLPRWHGQPGDWEKFSSAVGKQFGSEHYVVCVLEGMHWEGTEVLTQGGIDWQIFKDGLQRHITASPSDIGYLNMFARYAWLMGDKDTAKPLFAAIGNRVQSGVWNNKEADFRKAKSWAED